MITIKILSGKVQFIRNGSPMAFPFAVHSSGFLIKITSLGINSSSFEDTYENFEKENGDNFLTAAELVDYLTPYQGFSSPTPTIETFYSVDGIVSDDSGTRQVGVGVDFLNFVDISTMRFVATRAPQTGHANFERVGYGNSASSIVDAVSSSWGDIAIIYADGYEEHFGNCFFSREIGVGTAPTVGIGAFISGFPTSIYAIGTSQGGWFQSTDGFGGRFTSVNNSGGYFESSNGDGGEFHSSGTSVYAGKFIGNGNAGGVYAYATAGWALRVNGGVLFDSLPSSITGVPGKVYTYNDGIRTYLCIE